MLRGLGAVSLALLVAVTACTLNSPAQALRTGSGAYDDATRNTVLFGGEDFSQGIGIGSGGCRAQRDTWTWNGHAWTRQHATTNPPARAAASMAYDAAHRQVVLFGGHDCSSTPPCPMFNDTWTWDGTTWTEQHPQRSPPARDGAAMAYDASQGQVVLFGGSAGSALGDTWTWDGQEWTEQAPPVISPPARFRAKMAYDAAQQQVVHFGGMQFPQAGPPQNLTDTWTWDGTSWTQAANGTTPPRLFSATMTADDGRGGILLVRIVVCSPGAFPCGGGNTATWLWDGSTWSEQDPTTSAPAVVAGITYDGTRRAVVLFGGPDCSASGCNAWAWDGHAWNKLKRS